MADEYIRRSDAIALMKKEAAELNEAFDELGGESGAYAEAYEDAANMLKEMPAADVAPVVRCKDCQNWKQNVGFTGSPNGHCFEHDIDTNGCDFCSYGERKDNDEHEQ